MAALKAAPQKPKQKLRVSYVLGGGAHETRHCFGVSALASPPASGSTRRIYSGGRDSLIFLWSVEGDAVTHVKSFSQHTDWVNDIFLAEEGRILVSASSDTTIKVWDTESASVIKSIGKHSDYVKALAYAPKMKCFASAGLDKRTATSSISIEAGRSPITGHKDSIYSIAVNSAGSALVTGSTDNVVRVWDMRDGKKTMKLKGHTDNVKAVLVNEDGTLAVSGSSDGSMRLWDLRQQRNIHTYDPHTDSVWALAADEGFTKIYSGGRDKRVFLTELSSNESTLLFEEKEPVVRVLLNSADETLWSTSTSPSVHAWAVENIHGRRKAKFAVPERPQLESSSPTGVMSARAAAQVALEGTSLITAPRVTIGGRAGIVKHHVLNNRRQVLTQDAAGKVVLWDVMRGIQVGDMGDKESIDDHAKRLDEMLAIASWFSVDTRTGAVMINLDTPQCFSGECYAEDIPGYKDAEGPLEKINLGERVLAALFVNWAKGVHLLAVNTLSPPSSPDPGAADPERSKEKKEKKDKKEKEKKEKETKEVEEKKRAHGPLFALPEETPVIISDESSGSVILRTTVAQLTGKELSFSIPSWVQDAVLQGDFALREQPKVAFSLVPVDLKEIKKGNWNDSKLSGARLMKARKVAAHVVNNLNVKLPVMSATDAGPGREWLPHEVIEIICAKTPVDPNLTLAAVRQFIWKSSDDLVFHYRFTDAYRKYMAMQK